jgi:protein SCO1/2
VRFAPPLLFLLAACAAGESTGGTDLHGTPLPHSVARPAFTLRSVDGAPFDFRTRTGGRLTLLFFGYANCPDVCPATMGNLAAVMNRLTSLERDRIDVVFVTTDPERDRPDSLRAWLGRIDPTFVGLTGTVAEVEAAQRAAGVAVAIADSTTGAGYQVSHAAQVLVYSPDDSSHVAYPFGTRQSDWAEDLPKLLERWQGR